MKQTEKQKEETLKNQTQVNGHANFENGKLVTPVVGKKPKKTEDKKTHTKKSTPKKVKPEVTVDNFRDMMKDKPIEFSNTKDGWLKIKVTGKKIISYMKQGKSKPGIIMWNNLEKKQQHIKDKKELNNYIKSVDIFIKG